MMTDGEQGDPSLEETRRYLGSLVHALNQPLTAIMNYLEAGYASLDDDTGPILREAIVSARPEGRRAAGIAREITQVLGRRGSPAEGEHDPNVALETVALELPQVIGARVRLELDRDVELVSGDGYSLTRVLLAIARSAAKGVSSSPEADLTVVLSSHATPGCPRIELLFQAEGVDPRALDGYLEGTEEDPLLALARISMVDEGGRVAFERDGPTALRYHIHLTPA